MLIGAKRNLPVRAALLAIALSAAALVVTLSGCASERAGEGTAASDEGPCYAHGSVTSEYFQDSTSSWGGTATVYERDGQGRVVTDEASPTSENAIAAGFRREYSYSEDGDALVATAEVGEGAYSGSRYEVRYEYDGEGRVVRQTSLTFDEVSSAEPGYAQSCEYVYDDEGRIRAVVTVVNDEFSSLVLFDEDGYGFMHYTDSGIVTAEQASEYASYMRCEHDAEGRPVRTTLAAPGGDMFYVTTYEHDGRGHVSGFRTVDSAGQEVVDCSVSYGSDGQVERVEDVVEYPGFAMGSRCELTWQQVDDPAPFVRATSRLVTPENIGRLI